MKNIFLFVLLFSIGNQAQAGVITVDATYTRTNAGGLDTGIDVIAGDLLNITADASDLWNVFPGNSDQNADGDPPNCGAGGVGPCGALWTNHGMTASVGALAAYIGPNTSGNSSFFVGINFSQVVTSSGRLFLHSFDGAYSDNTGSILVNVETNSVPGPAPFGLLLLGLGSIVIKRRLT